MIKIGLVSEYFPPFIYGGAEVSTYYLASQLSKYKDMEIHVITPGYKGGEKTYDQGFRLYKFPYKSRLDPEKPPTSFFNFNPVWVFIMAWYVYLYVKNHDIDILHINGKFSILPVKIANIFLKKKIVLTIRDYQVICNYGFCLYSKDKACNLLEYFTKDFWIYIKYYTNGSINTIIINLIFAIWGRFMTRLIFNFSKGTPTVVLSTKQAEIFKRNGFKKLRVIHNSIAFPNTIEIVKPKNYILFAGRLTVGKGVQLLLNISSEIFKQHPDLEIIFAGSGHLRSDLQKKSQVEPKIKLLGHIPHEQLLKLYKFAMVTVVPSVWQEPFGRIPLESISEGTPALVTNRGGLPEIVKDERWGKVVEPDEKQLLEGITNCITNNSAYRRNIQKDWNIIKKRFSTDVCSEYIKLYKSL